MGIVFCASLAAATDGWLTDFEAAKKASAERQVPILADFSGSDWCTWCIRLEKEVLGTDAFKTYAASNLVLFVADFPQNKQQPDVLVQQNGKLASTYGVKAFPTLILMDATGRELARTGYQRGGAEAYIEHLKSLLVRKTEAGDRANP
jgi:thioredoxin-related protein